MASCISQSHTTTTPPPCDPSPYRTSRWVLPLCPPPGGDTEVWGDRPDALIAETLDLLRSLAAIDESVGVRQLASMLHETLFKGAT